MRRIKKIFFVIFLILCLFLGWWMTMDNDQPVDVVLLGFVVPGFSLGIWLLVMLVAGIALGMLASLPAIVRSKSGK